MLFDRMTAAAVAAVAPPSTLDELFVAEYARVVAIARRIVADAAEAEDVAQDVFADLARAQTALYREMHRA